jgi:YVTN family beta-propeller protein
MKSLRLSYLSIALASAAMLASCHKDKVVTPDKPTAQRAGLYILDQGNLGKPNSALTYYDYTTKTLTPDIFLSVNGQGLGNTANDIEVYGGKMYIVVDESGVVDVVDPKTAKLIKQVTIQNSSNKSLEPRDITFYKGNAYISIYNGANGEVAVMDTATYTISKYIPVGRNPEQLAVSNGKLYVANSGGLSAPDFDNTVSVIDLATLTETTKITVGSDPYAVSVDTYGDVFVASYAIYDSNFNITSNANLSVINSSTDAVISKTDFSGGPFSISGDNAYYIDQDGTVKIYDVKTHTISSQKVITDGTTFTAAYAVYADSLTGEVFVTDAKDYNSNGLVYAFDKTGKKEYSLVTGISPGSILPVNK